MASGVLGAHAGFLPTTLAGHRNLVPLAQLPEPSTGQPEPGRDVDDGFGPDFAVEGLTSQPDPLLPHRQIPDPVRRCRHMRQKRQR